MGCCASSPKPFVQPPEGCGKNVHPNQVAKYDGGAGGPAVPLKGPHGKYWTTNRHDRLPIQKAQVGCAGQVFPEGGLATMFEAAARKAGPHPALRVERHGGRYGAAPKESDRAGSVKWEEWTWSQYYDESVRAAKGFRSLGLQDKNAVCVYGFNSPEWFMAQQGAMLANGAVLGIYPTDKVDNVQYKARHGGANIACVESEKHMKTFLDAVRDEALGDGYPGIPTLKAIVVWGGGGKKFDDANIETKQGPQTVRVLTWQQLVEEESKKTSDKDISDVRKRIFSDSLAGYIYTSGTTGKPKAVMVSHDNILYMASCITKIAVELGTGGQERILSYLPLSHVAGLLIDIINPMYLTHRGPGWATVAFARPTDLKGDIKLADRIKEIKPTTFLGVPRVWEKIRDKMVATSKATPKSPGDQAKIDAAKERGKQHAINMQLGGSGVKPGGCLDRTIDGVIYGKVKEALGLTECKFAITGAAPIDVSCLEFFGQLGININEVYGMSECTGATTVSNNLAHVWGSCGFALPGAEVKVFKESKGGGCDANRDKVEAALYPDFAKLVTNPENLKEDCQGEVCFRGRHVMMGYMANPDLGEEHVELIKKKTAESIDDEGWLHSGDKGAMDTKGMVKITGRFKEIIIGAGGENVSPIPIEEAIKKDPSVSDLVSNVMMVGDKRKYCVALISLKVNGATGAEPGGIDLTPSAVKLVEGAGGRAKTVPEASDDDVVIKLIATAVARANKDSKVCPGSVAMIKSFTIIPRDFSEATGQLTATLKLKRSVVENEHESMVGSRDMIGGADPGMTGVLYKTGELVDVPGIGKCYGKHVAANATEPTTAAG